MRWTIVSILTSLMLAACPAWSEMGFPSAEMAYHFDESQQMHPKKANLAIPVLEPVFGEEGSQVSFYALYLTQFRMGDDPRNSQGKVILKVQLIRNDRIVWQAKKKDRIKYDLDTTRECGNCTHKLNFRKKFYGSLQAGDLVLFRFKFRNMPRFEIGESASFGGMVW